jgi:hypothetical protein
LHARYEGRERYLQGIHGQSRCRLTCNRPAHVGPDHQLAPEAGRQRGDRRVQQGQVISGRVAPAELRRAVMLE